MTRGERQMTTVLKATYKVRQWGAMMGARVRKWNRLSRKLK